MSGGPEEVVGAFFAALEGRRWADAAALVHPAVLARHREETRANVGAAREGPEPPPLTAEDLLRHEPGMPREVAEYQARRASEGMREHRQWALEAAGVASPEELERLSAAEVFARFLSRRDEGHVARRAMEGQGDETTRELLARAMPRSVRRVVGAVPAPGAEPDAGGERAYVVYSVALESPHLPAPEYRRTGVVGVRRDGAGWTLDPGETSVHELFGGGNIGISVEAGKGSHDLAEAMRRPAVWPAEGPPRLRARVEGAGDDPLRDPPAALVLEGLGPDGAVLARVEVPAEAWGSLNQVVSLWSLLVLEPPEPV